MAMATATATATAKAARKSTAAFLYWVRSNGDVASFSTEATMVKPAEAVETAPEKNEPEKRAWKNKSSELYRQISRLGGSPAKEVTRVLNKWLHKGNSVTKYQLIRYIHELRKYKKHDHALQLYEWMDNRGMNMSHSDYAVRLDLIYKCNGIDSAETYFEKLPEEAKNKFTYGSLLNCFCMDKSLDKAVAIVETMKEQDIELSTLGYNNLMTLYMKLEQCEKVLLLFQLMKDEGMMPNTYSYNLLMNSHAALNDIDAVESVLQEVKSANGGAHCDWTIYSNLAAIYVAAGLSDKAESALQELEKMAPFKDHVPYQFLITLYASTSNQTSVERVWGLLRTEFPKPLNMSYLAMLQSLSKLGDLNGLAECFEEWESNSSVDDIRLANVVISAYLRQGMSGEATLVIEKALKKGSSPNFRTFEIFIDFYLENNQYDLALAEFEKAAMMVTKDEWQPNQNKVLGLLKYFEEIKDVNGADEFYKKLKKLNSVNADVYNSLLRTYIAAGRSDPRFRQRMEDDGVEINAETEELLDKL